MKVSSMMGIESPTASHLPILERVVRGLEPGALVIEHGAGLYSTPLLARLGARVICAESHPGWAEWANWIYQGKAEIVDSYKRLVPLMGEAAAVFIDGVAIERGRLLKAALDHRVPWIIMHDTNEDEWGAYGLYSHYFKLSSYEITHHAENSHRTTLWRRHTGVPFDPLESSK